MEINESYKSDSKRVAKNTILLYIRMIVLMIVGFITSRVILGALGVEDYGIYSVIAGFLSMFGIISGSLSSAISRFITVELGKGDIVKLKKVFSTSVSVQIIMGIIVSLLIETVGLWFVENEMNIPLGKESAALFCLHCATITIFINLVNIPFSSTIVAHEKMTAFAYMTIGDAVLKLLICYLLVLSPNEKLMTYAFLGVCVSFIISCIYWIYCLICFKETSFKLKIDKGLFLEIWKFAGWNFFGQTSWILNTQGINMLMNVFFGVAINAARGIAEQVNSIINQFVNNFMLALNPQITKSYATGDKSTAYNLACRGARFSFYIMLIISLPVMIESEQLLRIWLVTPPEYSSLFVKFAILSTFTTVLGNTLVVLQMAHGAMKKYQLCITTLACLPFPLTYMAFKLGASPVIAYYIFFIIYWCLIYVRFCLVHQFTGIPARQYLLGVVLKTHIVFFISAIPPFMVFLFMPESFYRLLIVAGISIISTCIIIWLIGLESSEKQFFKISTISLCKKIINK